MSFRSNVCVGGNLASGHVGLDNTIDSFARYTFLDCILDFGHGSVRFKHINDKPFDLRVYTAISHCLPRKEEGDERKKQIAITRRLNLSYGY